MLTISPELASFQTGGQSWGVKDVSSRKMNQDLCPLSNCTTWPGASCIRMNGKRRWSLVLENTMKEIVRKLTGSEERKQITVKRQWVSRELTGLRSTAIAQPFGLSSSMCSMSRIISPHRIWEALAGDTANTVTLTELAQLRGFSQWAPAKRPNGATAESDTRTCVLFPASSLSKFPKPVEKARFYKSTQRSPLFFTCPPWGRPEPRGGAGPSLFPAAPPASALPAGPAFSSGAAQWSPPRLSPPLSGGRRSWRSRFSTAEPVPGARCPLPGARPRPGHRAQPPPVSSAAERPLAAPPAPPASAGQSRSCTCYCHVSIETRLF